MNQPDFNSIAKNFSLLLEVEDWNLYTQYIEKSYIKLGLDESFKEFLASEEFGKNLQRRISEASDLKNTMECLSYVRAMNQRAADIILNYRGFAQSVLPAKINNEYDVNTIGLCFEVVGYHNDLFAEIALQDGDVDLELLIEKFNFDEDIYNIGHALDRINRVDLMLTKTIVGHKLFNHNRIKELISKETDDAKSGEYLYAIEIAAPEIAKSIYNLQ